ncbi:MAG: hypothetical protein QOI66_4571 [Myxococcales bacterium]|jgi:hypothetical protein|nr:hypothetical protein [Myxococcales bacterium]
MSDSAENKITAAATAVMKALETLSVEECARVLRSAAALHGIGLSPTSSRSAGPETFGAEGGDHDHDLGEPSTKGKRLSIVEFLRQKDPATNSQRIAAFAFYREHVEGKATFVRGDLEHYFATAKLAKPGNYDRDFAGAIREGWIHEDGSESYLTQGGERAVREGFEGKAKPRGASVAKQK